MHHRHLNHQKFTLAAIDDIIGNGKNEDWADLRSAVLADLLLCDKVLQICNARVANPYEQRYHFWKGYVERYVIHNTKSHKSPRVIKTPD